MPHPDRLDEIFGHARARLDQVDSVRPQVDQRLANLSPLPAPWSPSRLAIPALALIALGAVLWSRLTPPPPSAAPAATPLAALSTLTAGDAELVEHLAAVVDRRAVVVIWSYRGPGLSTDPADRRAGQYRLHTLRRQTTPDGRTLVWSLFIPDPGVHPVLEPPSFAARLPDDTFLALSASPRPTSASAFSASIRSAGIADQGGPSPEAILRAIDTETR